MRWTKKERHHGSDYDRPYAVHGGDSNRMKNHKGSVEHWKTIMKARRHRQGRKQDL